jgi:uncharacterized protein (TIGR03663 family)
MVGVCYPAKFLQTAEEVLQAGRSLPTMRIDDRSKSLRLFCFRVCHDGMLNLRYGSCQRFSKEGLAETMKSFRHPPQLGQQAGLRSLFTLITNRAVMGALVTLIIALTTREILIGYKVMHHDESLHAYYASLILDGRPHVYSAMLHGPFMFYFGALWQGVFGFSDAIARQPVATLGTLAAVLVWFLPRRYFPFAAKCMLAGWLSLSPYFLYYSRFLRNDIFVILGLVLAALGLFHHRARPLNGNNLGQQTNAYSRHIDWHRLQPYAGPLLLGIGISLQYLSKENSFLHSLIAVCWILSGCLVSTQMRQTVRGWADTRALILVASLVVFPFILFYSSFFRHPNGSLSGVLDGLYRESIGYWWKENKGHRIKGTFDYHFPILFHYESGLIPILLLKSWMDTRNILRAMLTPRRTNPHAPIGLHANVHRPIQTKMGWQAALITFIPPVLMLIIPLHPLPSAAFFQSLASVLHVSHVHHLVLIAWLITAGGFLFFGLLRLNRICDAALWFWLIAFCGAYSYVGEKVPWLGIYIAFAAVLVAARAVPLLCRGWRTPILPAGFRATLATTAGAVIILCAHSGWKSLRLNYLRPADPAERLAYTHTTQDLLALPQLIAQQLGRSTNSPNPAAVTINLSGSPVWPLAWYARVWGWTPSFNPVSDLQSQDPDVSIFGDEDAHHFPSVLHQTHTVHTIPLRAWWVPYPRPSIAEISLYFLTGEPYLPPGGLSTLVDGVKSLGHTSFHVAVRRQDCTPNCAETDP